MEHIAYIRSDFPNKFGIPRQSGLVDSLVSRIVFAPAYRNPDALRGIEGFSHLWLIWEFSESVGKPWSPTVRPPRLGGNTRLGVFATRSPFRPNPMGLSCVRLLGVEDSSEGRILVVAGADLMDGTPIYDIKPYVPYADCHPEALGGFTTQADDYLLEVQFPEEALKKFPEDRRKTVVELLSHDPRPSYQKDPQRIYGMTFAGKNIRFRVEEKTLIVIEVL
jgi:tRNA-Thr(GGU) m(6)t(6)A37 methyltransferase TsaA